MGREKRKSGRRPMNMVAYLYSSDGWPLGECKLLDVSNSGAKLALSMSEALPAELIVSLSRNGKVRRQCQLVWQKDDQIGVRFRTI